jgi:oxygen-independent coproporphyrinogen-3 oxidase
MANHAQLSRLGLFDTSVPRYTSYPTAAQFNGSVSAETYARWLAAVPEGASISLYLHVPFCRRLCWFCACRTQGTSTLAPVAAYVGTLIEELRLVRAAMAPGITLSRLHWGGGTPTLIPDDLMGDLLRAIKEAFPFAPAAEFSVEIDPNEIDDARLDALVRGGMNRASIGVQDFDPAIQEAIGRPQSFEITRDVAQAIRARGIAGWNADMVHGLPYQSLDRIEASVGKLLTLAPTRVALYGYAHVPWMSRRQQMIPDETLPSPTARLALFDAAARMLTEAGYQQIGIDHFALPGDGLARAAAEGRLRRNFQGYTDDTAPVLIGLGASAISKLPQGFAQNQPATANYTRAVKSAELATHRGLALSPDDEVRGRMIEMLMCDMAADLAALRRQWPAHALTVDTLAEAIADRFGVLVDLRPGRLEIRPGGRPLTRLIARMCDANAQAPARYSAAI